MLVAASSAKMAGFGVPSSVPKWRAIQNKTTNSYAIEIACDFFHPHWFDRRRRRLRPHALP
jgi:hypothetical protein